MEELDVSTLQQKLVRLKLANEDQIMTALDETGNTKKPLELLRALEKKGVLTPFHTSKILKGDEDGFFLGGYLLLYKIASGSFGRVYRAQDPQSGRVVAIKVLRRRWSEDKQRIALFMREGKMGLTLKNPYIVETLAVNQDPVTLNYYIVMEFIEGGNLREILAIRKKLDPAEACKWLEDLTQGLSFAYSQGVTHRDIKLTNILISSSGHAKLVDFGLAQFFSGDAREDDERVERTVDYAGLEKLTGVKPGDVRSDIYFLGTVMYQMLTGRSPIQWGRDKQARMNPKRFNEVVPMSHDEVDAPGLVFQLVESMMTLSPADRYQTPNQLLEAVRAARHEIAVQRGEVEEKKEPPSVFVVEADDRLQEAIREKLKKHGYRVFIAMDPTRAVDRFRQKPYDALIIDAGTTDEEGMLVFDRIMGESFRQGIQLCGILILSQDQADWKERVTERPSQQVLVRPVTLKQLHRELATMLKKD